MNCNITLIQLIETVIGLAMITLLAVIAKRSHPDEHLDTTLFVVLGALLMFRLACGFVDAYVVCRKPTAELVDQDQKGETNES